MKPAPWWLGDREQGLALGGVAPPQLFRLGNDVHVKVRTMERAYDVQTSGAAAAARVDPALDRPARDPRRARRARA